MNSDATTDVRANRLEIGSSCAITVIVEADRSNPDPGSWIRGIQGALAGLDAQLIVTSREPWLEAPEGVEVVDFPSAGLGDRYDAASKGARGTILAFVDSRVAISAEWALKAVQLFIDDPGLAVAGGPIVPIGAHRSERISALVMTHHLRKTPAAHNARVRAPRLVREVGASNLVVRATAFRAVGGFQTPAGNSGESVRLCYKVRSLLGGHVLSDPALALRAPAPRFPGQLLRAVASYGRSRGDMARRLPEAARLFPYAVPSLLAILLAVGVIAVATVGRGKVGWVLLAALALFAIFDVAQSLIGLTDWRQLGDRLLAGLAVPVVLIVFGVTFLRGYAGRSLGNVSPLRERQAPLRVLIMNWRDVTHPWSGGAETYMHQLARRWAADGIDVRWLTMRHAGSPRHEVIDRIHIHRVGGRLTLYPRAAITYITRLRGRYDVIVDCENGIPFFSPLYSRLPKILVVHHVHQEIFRRQLPRQVRWFALWLEGWLMPKLYRHSQVVAVSEGTRSDLVDLGFDGARISIVTNGVVPPDPVDRAQAQEPTILCMGRLAAQKSVDVLIRAMPMMIEHIPNLRLDIVGQGPDRTRLERLAWGAGLAGHIRFHGYVQARVRDEITAAAWLAACPSAFEGWGVVCMEASARGLPVVASDVAGLRESVRHTETGYLFPYGDEKALAEAIMSLIDDPELRARMGAAGREWAARHTWNESASRFGHLLTAQVERPSSPSARPAVPAQSWR